LREVERFVEQTKFNPKYAAFLKPPSSTRFDNSSCCFRKVLTDFARETGKGSSSYAIQKAFDEDPDFTRDLALTCAASYAKKPM
ncbi:MAG: hypothetical protein SGJ19_16610, partial [Planctomycetia bacterium]|nr:hypothetical protein [Planctomycetia bacterium]